MSLQHADFPAFYEAANGYAPFPWQAELVAAIGRANGHWPAVLDLPTSAGKTSALDAAVFLLALEVEEDRDGNLTPRPVHERNAAVRTFFVVDRRIVVDEAALKARALAKKLNDAPVDGTDIIARVAARLRAFTGTKTALHVAVLRGGMYRDGAWAESPTQPTVCLSTVDQVGSRLLFRGYGVSPYQRAVHAALVGNDALILVDEAHLSVPFVETLKAVEFYRSDRWAEKDRHVRTPFQTVVLSATIGDAVKPVADDGVKRPDTLRLSPADRTNTVLQPRLAAEKLAELESFNVPKDEEEDATRARFARRLADRAVELSVLGSPPAVPAAALTAGPTPPKKARGAAKVTSKNVATPTGPAVVVVGIVVNRVDTARRVFDLLRARVREHFALPAGENDNAVILLTGRIRPYDRDELLFRTRASGADGWLPVMKAAKDRPAPPRGVLFVVATQTVEVGADLSFDALVTEAAPLDALRQRFGRLDRLGERGLRGGSNAVVIGRSDKLKDKDDPVYGPAVVGVWKWLDKVAKKKPVDFGVDALAALMERDPPAADVYAPRPHAPVMLPAHVDDWVQTSVPPAPDPEPALFLHGPKAGPADVSVVWRADVTEGLLKDAEQTRQTVALVPPTSMEALPVPIWHVRKWLQGVGKTEGADFTDLEGEAERGPADGNKRGRAKKCRAFLVWNGPDKDDGTDVFTDPDKVYPGATIVVPSRYGGCDEFGWNPADAAPVKDVADDCSWRAKRRPVLRVQKASGVQAHALAAWRGLAPDLAGVVRELLGDADENDAGEADGPDWREAGSALAAAAGRLAWLATARRIDYPDGSGVVYVARGRPAHPDGADASAADDVSGSFTAPAHRVTLEDHCRGVHTVTDGFTRLLGLRKELSDALSRAALLHDAGKADPRFQLWLYGNEAAAAKDRFALIAKSGTGGRNAAAVEAARKRSGWPKRARHEALSVLLVRDRAAELAGSADPDLFVHLVGTHHGRGRPLWPFDGDAGTAADGPVTCEFPGVDVSAPAARRPEAELMPLGAGWVDSFWRIVARYGPWGAAYLETLLVLADHRRSSAEQEANR